MAVVDFAALVRATADVVEESTPGTSAELTEILQLDENTTPVFVGAGGQGGPVPEGPLRLVHLRHLEGETKVSTDSLTLTLPASMTWAAAQSLATSSGLCLDHLVDTWGERTIGGTLAATEILPALWMSSTARASCLALSALSLSGVTYDHINAPRTASGPDLRALFFGCHGTSGPILSAAIEARRAGATETLVGEFHRGLQVFINEFGSVLSARGDARGVSVRVRVDSRLGRLAAQRVSEAGLAVAEPKRPGRPETVLTVPWARVSEVNTVCADATVVSAGPTHVAYGTSFAAMDAEAARFSDDNLSRWIEYSPRKPA